MNGYDDNTFLTPDVSGRLLAQGPSATGFTTLNTHVEAQSSRPRSVFTLDADAGITGYWDRPGDSWDFNTRVALLYLNRLNPRTQFTTNLILAYLSQPDFANPFAAQSTLGGDYVTSSLKLDLAHRWTRHFSTNTSASMDLLYFTDQNRLSGGNSFINLTFGNEFRFRASPRLTWVLDTRYSMQEFFDASTLNSDTLFALAGFDWIWSRRLSTTVRAGVAFRSFERGGDSTDPYAEISANYQTSRRSSLIGVARYGYEQTNAPGGKNLAYRLNLRYMHALTHRLSADAGFSYVGNEFTNTVGPATSSDIFDMNVGLQYRLTRNFSVATRYFYTIQNSTGGLQDYDRNRLTLSLDYLY